MTMIAALIFPDRALLVADSVCCYPGGAIVVGEDGHAFEDHKLIELPGGVVLTLLGSLSLRHYAAADIRELHGFDAVLEHLPAVLRAGAAHLGERVDGAPLGAGGNTAVLAGWSSAKGTMAMAALKAGNNFEPEVHGPWSFWRNPESPGADPYAIPADRDALVTWAHDCVRGHRVLDPMVPVGGKLRLAEVTKTGCTISVAGDLGLPSPAAPGYGVTDAVTMFAGQIAPDAVTASGTTNSSSRILGIDGDAAAATRATLNEKVAGAAGIDIDVVYVGTGSDMLITGDIESLQVECNTTNAPTTATLAAVLIEVGVGTLKSAKALVPLVQVTAGVANNDGGGHGTYNFMHGEASPSLVYEYPGYTGSKTFRLRVAYNLLNAAGAPVAPAGPSYISSLSINNALLNVREFKR